MTLIWIHVLSFFASFFRINLSFIVTDRFHETQARISVIKQIRLFFNPGIKENENAVRKMLWPILAIIR